MKILFLGRQFGLSKAGGFGSAYKSIYLPLTKFSEAIFVPVEKVAVAPSQERALLDICEKEKPDVLWCWTDPSLEEKALRAVTAKTKISTVGIFGDDDSGFFNCWNRFAGSVFDWEITFYPHAVEWHKELGGNVIGTHVPANPDIFKPNNSIKRDILVSFVGNCSPQRKQFFGRLNKELVRDGIEVRCFGNGWTGGMLPLEKMVETFERSKVNLNMAGVPLHSWRNLKSLARLFLKKTRANGKSKIVLDIRNFKGNLITFRSLLLPICRERLFEIIATRSFVLTSPASYFPGFFTEGKEIVHYKNIKDLASKIRYYLRHENERESIAAAAYEKFLAKYQAPVILRKIFDIIYTGDPKRKTGEVVVI